MGLSMLHFRITMLYAWMSIAYAHFNAQNVKRHVRNTDQETSPSLIPNSQTRVSTSSIAESSQSLIPHSQKHGPWSTNHRVGDLVKIFTRKRRDGSLVTSVGTVTHVRPDRRVKTDTCSNYFRPVLRTIVRLSTSMIPDDTQSQSAHSLSQVF